MQVSGETPHNAAGNREDQAYREFLGAFQAMFDDVTGPVFETDVNVEALWGAYIHTFHPGSERQYHNCTACRHFIQRFGGLVLISDNGGATKPLFWTPSLLRSAEIVGPTMVDALANMAILVREARVTGVFLSGESKWGQPVTGPWRHLGITVDRRRMFKHPLMTAGQAMAAKRHNFETVKAALSEYTLPQLEQAVQVCESDQLYRGEKVLASAQWLRELKAETQKVRGEQRRDCVIWRYIADAPEGFCHPRSSMIGTLLDDLRNGYSPTEAATRFKDKMHPLLYQRPQALPKAGNIEQAERIVDQMNLRSALDRRLVRREELEGHTLWAPRTRSELRRRAATAGEPAPVFGGVPARSERPAAPSAQGLGSTITWVKFAEKVLPSAERIQVRVPSGYASFGALVTAVDPEAAPLLKWDREDNRNPFSWYLWANGSPASQYGLRAGSWADLDAITLKPCFWKGNESPQEGKGLFLSIEKARETRTASLALFPEILKGELHAVRSTIEAYSQRGQMKGLSEPHVAGLLLHANQKWDIQLAVTSNGVETVYTVDRFD